jgi:hypothetical protein
MKEQVVRVYRVAKVGKTGFVSGGGIAACEYAEMLNRTIETGWEIANIHSAACSGDSPSEMIYTVLFEKKIS